MADLEWARLALSTGSLYNLALDRVFKLCAATGFDGVELLIDARVDSHDLDYLRTLSKRWQVPILSMHVPFASRVEGWPKEQAGRVERTVGLAEALGAQTVVVHLPLRWHLVHIQTTFHSRGHDLVIPWPNREGALYERWLRDDLKVLQARSSVCIAVENMPARRLLGQRVSLYHASTLPELQQWPFLTLDTTHWGTWGIDAVDAYQALREHVAHVHLSNYDGREHRLPFAGHLRLAELLRLLGRDGFQGIVTVELEPSAVAGEDWSEEHLGEVLSEVQAACRQLLTGSSHSHSAQAQLSAA